MKNKIEIYVKELPKSCEDCPLCQNGFLRLQKGKYVEAKGCVLGDYYKYTTIDDEIDTYPLKLVKKVD